MLWPFLWEVADTRRGEKNQECAGPKQILCVECLVILINTRRVLKLSQCPRHLLIIIMRVVSLVYYLCVWAFSLIYFSSFERNENEVKFSLINLKCINTNQNWELWVELKKNMFKLKQIQYAHRYVVHILTCYTQCRATAIVSFLKTATVNQNKAEMKSLLFIAALGNRICWL